MRGPANHVSLFNKSLNSATRSFIVRIDQWSSLLYRVLLQNTFRQ